MDDVLVFGPTPEEGVIDQIANCRGEKAALMADNHLGYSQPIGGVVAYQEQVSPSGVGYDIACGNLAVRLDVDSDEFGSLWERSRSLLMDEIASTIQFGVGKSNPEAPDHPLFESDPAWDIDFVAKLKPKARAQLGTVGSGNHYVDLFRDELDRPWVGVHFGSRGLGHSIASEYMRRGGGGKGMMSAPALLTADSQDGQEYIAAMKLAGRYAYAGREWVCRRVAEIVGAPIAESVHNHHNFAWFEEHDGDEFWVVRKGATPAFPGQLGFVGATMAEPSVILRGVDSWRSRAALFSTVHGAGRVMSRTKAAGKFRWVPNPDWFKGSAVPRKVRKRVRSGEISRQEIREQTASASVELRGGGCDEGMRAYKRLDHVLAAHGETVEIVHTLTPIGVAMAGDGE